MRLLLHPNTPLYPALARVKTYIAKYKRMRHTKHIKLLDYLPFLLGQVYQRRQRQLEKALLPLGLREPEYRVLVALGDRNGCSVSQLAEWSVIDRTTLSRILTPMEDRGLLRRQRSVDDLRSFNVYLTDAGSAMLQHAQPTALSLLQQLTEGIPKEDVNHLKRILRNLNANLDTVEKLRSNVNGVPNAWSAPNTAITEGTRKARTNEESPPK